MKTLKTLLLASMVAATVTPSVSAEEISGKDAAVSITNALISQQIENVKIDNKAWLARTDKAFKANWGYLESAQERNKLLKRIVDKITYTIVGIFNIKVIDIKEDKDDSNRLPFIMEPNDKKKSYISVLHFLDKCELDNTSILETLREVDIIQLD